MAQASLNWPRKLVFGMHATSLHGHNSFCVVFTANFLLNANTGPSLRSNFLIWLISVCQL